MAAFVWLEQELVHIEKMVERLRELSETGDAPRPTAVMRARYWRRRINELVRRSDYEPIVVQRAAALLRSVEELEG